MKFFPKKLVVCSRVSILHLYAIFPLDSIPGKSPAMKKNFLATGGETREQYKHFSCQPHRLSLGRSTDRKGFAK